jgi:phosphate uptake regulator
MPKNIHLSSFILLLTKRGVPALESRKIIRFGKNSYVISIPKTWIEGNRLAKGDHVFIDEFSTDLRILPSEKSRKPEPKKIVIETENKDLNYLRSEIISAYLMNYNIIELVGNNVSEDLGKIKAVLRDLSGMEIMEVTSRRITAQDILSEEDVDIKNIMRRVDMIVRSMVIDSVKTVESDLSENINIRDLDVNRLVFLAFRVLKKAMKEPQFARKLQLSQLDVMKYWTTISELERIADQAKRAARYIRKMRLDEKNRKSFEKLYNSVYELYLDTMKSYYTADRSIAFTVIEDCKNKNADCNAFLEKNQTIEAAHSIEFIKSMNGLIKHIARIVTTTEMPGQEQPS